MYVDPMGSFGNNTKLSYNPNVYNEDERVLQNELAWNGYLTDSDVDGHFGPKTLAAVNKYKNDNKLWNYGEYEGVSTDFIGLDIGTSLVSAGVEVKIPIPFTNKKLIVCGEGELFAVGYHSYYDQEEKRIKIGAAAIVGTGVSVEIE